MKKIDYIIETLAPVSLAEKNNDSTLYVTKKYIPGSIVRGMLAGKFIQYKNLKNAHEDEDFYNIFLSGKVRFISAYPVGKNLKLIKNNFNPMNIPLSLVCSKDGKTVKDISYNKQIIPGYKKMNGFMLKADNEICKVDVDTQVELHMARNEDNLRLVGSNKDGRIFNYEYIEPNQFFKGYLIVDEDIVQNVKSFLDNIDLDNIHIGRSRNVQYGKCLCKIGEISNCNSFEYDVVNKNIYLQVLTPYIPIKEWQSVEVVVRELLFYIEVQLKNIGIDVSIKKENIDILANSEEVSGYVSVWQSMRERKRAISAGSLIELVMDKTDKNILDKMSEILYSGLGCRYEDGFGQFRLWQAMDNIRIIDYPEEILIRENISSNVKENARKIIQKRILLEVRKKAIMDAERVNPLKTKNVLNRVERIFLSNDKENIIIQEINGFKPIAKDNLRKIKLDGMSVYSFWFENLKMPYENIKWEQYLDLDDNKVKLLKNDLGNNIFTIDKDILFKEYWLWFIKHLKKIN